MRIKFIILTFIYLFFGEGFVLADFTFTIPNTTISSDEDIEATVILSLQGQNNKTYYLEGAFKNEASSNYFGLTWNDSSWITYTSSNFTTLKLITTDETGTWTGAVKTKIDKDNSLFLGTGAYTLRMKRFTTGGSGYWADNSVTLTVNSPPTPTPSPTPSPTPTPTPSPTPTPTPTPQLTPTPKKSSTSTPASTSTPKPSPSPTTISSSIPSPTKLSSVKSAVAGISKMATPSSSPVSSSSANIKISDQKQNNPFISTGIIFIIAGVGSLGYLLFRKNETIYNYFRRRN